VEPERARRNRITKARAGLRLPSCQAAVIEPGRRRPISRILSWGIICLSGLPEGLGGQPSNAFLFGLAPARVFRAGPVARAAGGLLRRRFTLACAGACALGHRRSTFCGTVPRSPPLGSPSGLPCGVRTFLGGSCPPRSPSPLLPWLGCIRTVGRSIPDGRRSRRNDACPV